MDKPKTRTKKPYNRKKKKTTKNKKRRRILTTVSVRLQFIWYSGALSPKETRKLAHNRRNREKSPPLRSHSQIQEINVMKGTFDPT